MVKSKIVNVVATATLDQEVDFEYIRTFKEFFHDSDVYGGRVVYFKSNNLQGKVIIFASGKMISVGATSEEEAFRELDTAKKVLIKMGSIQKVILKPVIRNMVISANFGKPVNLENLALIEHVIYDPKHFPAVILRLVEPHKAVVHVFNSGKVVITGLKSASQIDTVVERLNRLLKEVD